MEDMEFDKFIKPLETSLQGNLHTPIKYFYVHDFIGTPRPNHFFWIDIKF